MSEEFVRYEAADGVAVITLDRPAKRNALTSAMCEQLHQHWLRIATDDSVRAVVLTAASDDVFTAGADLNDPPPQFWKAVPNVGVVMPKPVIAAVGGLVIGAGAALVAMSDLCIAAENTKFVYPEAKVGIALGLIASVAARIPHKIAMELMLTGEPISVERAYQAGFVNRVTPVGGQRTAAIAMAKTIAANAPLVVAMLKEMALETIPQGPSERMYGAQRAINRVLESEDAKEGPRAFKEKRAPRFTGR